MEHEKLAVMILDAQKAEITEHVIYSKLARMIPDEHNSQILQQISREEKEHYQFWKQHTQQEITPSKFKVWLYQFLAKFFGLTFAIRLMERGEDLAQDNYHIIANSIPEVADIEADENEHEEKLINMIEEEKLQYVSSIVLGLNDALVELTGRLRD